MSDDTKILNAFEGDGSEQKNALITAMTECGKDFAKSQNRPAHDTSLYDWMEKTQKMNMITDVVNKLNELGYEIVMKDKNIVT